MNAIKITTLITLLANFTQATPSASTTIDTTEKENKIYWAIKHSKTEEVSRLLNSKESFFSPISDTNQNPLQMAVQEADYKTIKAIIDKGLTFCETDDNRYNFFKGPGQEYTREQASVVSLALYRNHKLTKTILTIAQKHLTSEQFSEFIQSDRLSKELSTVNEKRSYENTSLLKNLQYLIKKYNLKPNNVLNGILYSKKISQNINTIKNSSFTKEFHKSNLKKKITAETITAYFHGNNTVLNEALAIHNQDPETISIILNKAFQLLKQDDLFDFLNKRDEYGYHPLYKAHEGRKGCALQIINFAKNHLTPAQFSDLVNQESSSLPSNPNEPCLWDSYSIPNEFEPKRRNAFFFAFFNYIYTQTYFKKNKKLINDSLQSLRVMIENSPDRDMLKNIQFILEQKFCDCDEIIPIMQLISDKNYHDEEKNSSLYYFAINNKTGIIPKLTQWGANTNSKNSANHTPLHYAASKGYNGIIKELIENDGDVNAKNYRSLTPLHYAAANDNTEAIETLIRFGAIINAKTDNGITPLHYAATNGNTKTIETLIRFGAMINTITDDDLTPLHYAAANDNTEAIETLIHLGAMINAKTDNGITPLHYAATNGNTKAIETLIHLGAMINTITDDNLTSLHYAAANGNTEAIETLIHLGAMINAKTDNGITPLHLAASKGHDEAVETLSQYVNKNNHLLIDINESSNDDKNALHHAIIGN